MDLAGQRLDHLRYDRIILVQRRHPDNFQCIIEEMRINLGFQRRHLRLRLLHMRHIGLIDITLQLLRHLIEPLRQHPNLIPRGYREANLKVTGLNLRHLFHHIPNRLCQTPGKPHRTAQQRRQRRTDEHIHHRLHTSDLLIGGRRLHRNNHLQPAGIIRCIHDELFLRLLKPDSLRRQILPDQ